MDKDEIRRRIEHIIKNSEKFEWRIVQEQLYKLHSLLAETPADIHNNYRID